MNLNIDRIETPLGELVAVWEPAGLVALEFADRWPRAQRYLARRYFGRALRPATWSHRPRLDAYFAGDIAALSSVPSAAVGTPFQRRVWAALRGIQAGTTASYGELARSLGKPTASRAVGAANGQNPVGLVVPCHRVVGADGRLTGYAGGLDRKRWLLEHEGARASDAA